MHRGESPKIRNIDDMGFQFDSHDILGMSAIR